MAYIPNLPTRYPVVIESVAHPTKCYGSHHALITYIKELHFVQKTEEEGVNKIAYSIGQALDARDALSMALYELVFKWILNRISLQLKCTDHSAVISVVDCYGVEVCDLHDLYMNIDQFLSYPSKTSLTIQRYNNNGLEQLLINTVNEKLENAFVKQTFLEEMADYVTEGLIFDWKVITVHSIMVLMLSSIKRRRCCNVEDIPAPLAGGVGSSPVWC